jgi:hypothetical protein
VFTPSVLQPHRQLTLALVVYVNINCTKACVHIFTMTTLFLPVYVYDHPACVQYMHPALVHSNNCECTCICTLSSGLHSNCQYMYDCTLLFQYTHSSCLHSLYSLHSPCLFSFTVTYALSSDVYSPCHYMYCTHSLL